MFLTAKTIRRLIIEHDPPLIDIPKGTDAQLHELIDRVCEPGGLEGSVFEFTVNRVEVQEDQRMVNLLGKYDRVLHKSDPIPPSYFVNSQKEKQIPTWSCTPGTSYKLVSLETVNLPHWLCAFLDARTSTFRGQGDLSVTRVHPGFSGQITAEFHVIAGHIDIQQGFRFCQASFGMFIPDAIVTALQAMNLLDPREVEPYGGIWGVHTNNRTTTDGKTVRAY